MNRREFLQSIGLAAAAVSFGGAEAVVANALPPTSGWATETLHVGDVFTVAGRYAVNPVPRKSTGHLQQFVVTCVSDSDPVIDISPRWSDTPKLDRRIVPIDPLGVDG